MKVITVQEAETYLSAVGMRVDNWNRIIDATNAESEKCFWINCCAPRDSLRLHTFSQHVAGWLPKGDWKILQIDNSTSFDPVQASMVGSLLFGKQEIGDLNLAENRSFLFKFCEDESANESTELLIANLIYVLLLFEGHGYVVSSGTDSGQLVGIQDGFVYFYSKRPDISGAKSLLKNFEENPLRSPQWINTIVGKWQERSLQRSCIPLD
jgi:hypothetical protein